MGLDCNILVPNDVRVRDVANVIGILAGLPKSWQASKDGDTKWVAVEGAKTKSCVDTMPEMCTINLDGKMIDGQFYHFCYYHFENDDPNYRLVSLRSTPFWIAVGLGVCKFFGGKIDFNDCDAIDYDQHFPKPRDCNCPTNGKDWDEFNKRMYAVKPLTLKDLHDVRKFAGYDTVDVFKEPIVEMQ